MTLYDELGDTWDGTVLRFQPAGSIADFTLDVKGKEAGPIMVTFPRFTNVTVRVAVMGPWT